MHIEIILAGTTSACAENTLGVVIGFTYWWNYLRVRGEYMDRYQTLPGDLELPPRARRIPTAPAAPERPAGTTSACAENTWKRTASSAISPELPPRARRIQVEMIRTAKGAGTTSACAENTYGIQLAVAIFGNYLRVRGEYPGSHGPIYMVRELPPRARRIH